jgi:hypothetical protein
MAHNALYSTLPLIGKYEDTAGQTFMNALVMPLYYREEFSCYR